MEDRRTAGTARGRQTTRKPANPHLRRELQSWAASSPVGVERSGTKFWIGDEQKRKECIARRQTPFAASIDMTDERTSTEEKAKSRGGPRMTLLRYKPAVASFAFSGGVPFTLTLCRVTTSKQTENASDAGTTVVNRRKK